MRNRDVGAFGAVPPAGEELWTGAFEDLVGYRFLDVGPGRIAVALDLTDRHMNQYGIAHGGVPLTLLDAAGGAAVYALELDLVRIATVSMNTQFIKGPVGGRVIASGVVDGHGATLAYTTIQLRQDGETGPLLATAQATYRLFKGRAEGAKSQT